MNEIIFDLKKDTILKIGFDGEHNANKVIFKGFVPMTDGVIVLNVDGTEYLLNEELAISIQINLTKVGYYKGQIIERAEDKSVVQKSKVFTIKVNKSNPYIKDDVEMKPEYDLWFSDMKNLYDTVQYKLEHGEFKGEKGDKGDTGTIDEESLAKEIEKYLEEHPIQGITVDDVLNDSKFKALLNNYALKEHRHEASDIQLENQFASYSLQEGFEFTYNMVQQQEDYLDYLNANKVQVDGDKVLSTNDFTNEDKQKLDSLENYDDSDIRERINNIEVSKFPNVTIIGQPTINQGQLSNFSSSNYARFPFVVNFQNRPFNIKMDITTGSNVTNQENVIDSDFGLALAIRNSRLICAYSVDGSSWVGEYQGSHTINTNTSYLINLSWDGNVYKVDISTDGGEHFVTDMTFANSQSPYPKQIYIGVGENNGSIMNHFSGIINLNNCELIISDKTVWLGMDDIGLATRMAVDMSNIDEAGIDKINDIVDHNNTKVGYSEVVDNQLLMYSDSTKSHLLATLDLPSGGGAVNDVKINNASIVDENGEANIPVAKDVKQLGLFEVKHRYDGLEFGDDPYGHGKGWQLTKIENTDIGNRNTFTTARLPLTLNKLDYAVKQALCDGKGAEYTSAEKKSAQERLGIVQTTEEEYSLLDTKDENTFYYTGSNIYLGESRFSPQEKWELINEFVIDEETRAITLNTDKFGAEFSLKKIRIVGSRVCPQSGTHTSIVLRATDSSSNIAGWSNGTKLTDGWIQKAGASAGTVMYFNEYAENVTYCDDELSLWVDNSSLSANETSVNNQVYSIDSAKVSASFGSQNNSTKNVVEQFGNMKTIKSIFYGSYSICFGVGTVIKIYGVRA